MDGRYLLVTNDRQMETNEMLRLSKRRDLPEKRFSTVKGVLGVRPVYVHKQERVLALVFCTMVALLIYALIELECQRAAVPRTARALLAEFASLALVVTRFVDGSSLCQISGLSPGHLAYLDALHLPPIERYIVSNC